jgi:hypothetical protein
MTDAPAPEPKNRQWIRQLVDFGALAAFMISYFTTRDMIFATWVLVGASALALVVGFAVERRFAPLPLITGLFALVFGMLTLRGGTVRLNGEDITRLSPQARVAKGMAFVPQTQNIFTSMTVEENLEMGAFLRRDDSRTTMAPWRVSAAGGVMRAASGPRPWPRGAPSPGTGCTTASSRSAVETKIVTPSRTSW